MNSVIALIVDDEAHNRETLHALLREYCPNIQIDGEAKNADEAFDLIRQKKPQLVFLDVMMPLKSGFDLLKMFDAIHFEVVFVSAYNEYAVTAFDYNALGYILKPIDYNKLITTVNKAVLKIGLNTQNTSVLQFIKTLEPNTDSIAKLVIHHNENVILLDIAEIVSVKAKDDVCTIQLLNNDIYHSTRDLKLFDGMLKENGNFVRISKNTIINLGHLKGYQKGDTCILQMKNDSEFEVSRRKKTEVLHHIRLL